MTKISRFDAAVDAAAKAYRKPGAMLTNDSESRHYQCIQAALEAALPVLVPSEKELADLIIEFDSGSVARIGSEVARAICAEFPETFTHDPRP